MRPTKREAEKVLEAVFARYKKYGAAISPTYWGPTLKMDWDWAHNDGWPSLIWEEGPYDWAIEIACSDIELPKGVWLEPVNSWSLSIYVER
jgi:hypothetical protein